MGIKIEVEVVRRDRVFDHDSYTTGEAIRVGRSGLNRDQIVIVQPIAGGWGERTIDLALYYITATIFHYDLAGQPTTVPHETTESSQNKAFKVLESHLAFATSYRAGEAERAGLVKESKGETVSKDQGPKRVEVVLRGILDSSKEARLVVTDVSPPAGHFSNYTLLGRPWRGTPRSLQKHQESFWASTHFVHSIEVFNKDSVGSSQAQFFGAVDGRSKAWHLLEKEFLRLTDANVAAARAWNPEEEDRPTSDASDEAYDVYDLYDFYPGRDFPTAEGSRSSHRTRTTYTYKPPSTQFRVAGDDVGIQLFQEQLEREEEVSVGAEVSANTDKEAEGGDADQQEPDTAQTKAAAFLAQLCPSCNGRMCGPGRCFRDLPQLNLRLLPAPQSKRTH